MSARWRWQAEWYVDGANGHDENDGRVASRPIKTYRELSRRWNAGGVGEFPGPVDVVQVGNRIAGDKLHVGHHTIRPDAIIRFHGTATTVASGRITAKTDIDSATQTPPDITASFDGAGSFSTHLRKRIRLTSSANAGAIAWVSKILAATQVRTSAWGTNNINAAPYNAAVTAINPAVNDQFVIEELPIFPDFSFSLTKTSQGTHGDGVLIESVQIGDSSNDRFDSLTFSNVNIARSNVAVRNFAGHYHMAQTIFTSDVTFHYSNCTLRSCLKTGGSFTLHHGASLFLREQFMAQGVPLPNPTNGAFMEIFDAAVFDSSSDGIAVDTEGQLRISGPFWGNNNTGFGIRCDGRASYTAGNKPTVTSATPGNDTRIGGTIKAYAAIPYSEPTNLSMLVQRAT